ncbi:response regulator transcription factor [Domibacillus tundrae]|uniref:response regulator transcription factor n=1 Tax=Domibacillus tundrae TaxID=1587527 RepID=UPI000617D49D|nr:response regulator [Domibacillus tundrae]
MQQPLKVLIADDEPNIREGIRDAVQWEKYEMTVVAEAEDGEEALELALQHQIDILLVDLNMPIMNGLTVVKHIRESLSDCRVIIITGYDEFSYAQEALRLDVDDYLLKPVNPQNLTNVIEKTKRKIAEHSQEIKHKQIASSYIDQNKLIIQDRFCKEWVEGRLTEEEIKEQLQFLSLPVKMPQLLVAVRSWEFQIKQPLMEENDKEIFASAAMNIILEVFGDCQNVSFTDRSGLLFILIWEKAGEKSFSIMERLIQDYLNVAATVYSEEVTGGINNLNAAYVHCKHKVSEEAKISPLVRRSRSYIREHYADQDLTLESLAQLLQVSPVYLSRMIKKELGTTFVTLLTKTRMTKAIKLLNSTSLKINEVAEQVGYESQHYFSTAFKKAVGVSPNQYRKGMIN